MLLDTNSFLRNLVQIAEIHASYMTMQDLTKQGWQKLFWLNMTFNELRSHYIPPHMNFFDRFIFRNMEVAWNDITFHNLDDALEFVNNFLATLKRQTLTRQL